MDEARANSFYDMLVKTNRMDEKNREETLRRIQNPSRMNDFYDFLVKKKGFKEENREETMRRLYPGLHGVLPYADKRPGPGFESPVSMDKLPGLIRERQGQEQAKEDEAKQGFQDWLRTRDRKIEDARASLPGIREENDALYSAFSSLEQERAGRAVPGQDGDAPADALDSYGRMDAMNDQRMQDISQNLEYLDALEGQLDRMTAMQQASMPIPVGQEVKDRLIPEVRFDAVKQEELVPDLDRLSKEIGRVKSQTRALQQEYADSRIRLLETLDAAAALKMGGRILEEEVNDANREYIGMAKELASSMSREEAAEIYKYRSVVNDAIRNLDRMRKAAAVDGASSAWKRFWQGMGAAFDGGRGLATLGLSDVGEGIRALQALKRVQEGNGSEADRILVESLADRANAESLMDGGHAYGIGQSLYGSLEFILDMAVTGGLAAGLRKGAVKGVKKAVGRKVADAASKAASTRLGKATVKGADMALASAISPMTMQGTVERQQQNYLYGRDNEGRLVVRGVSMPESWFKSYVNAFGSNLISRFVEQSVGPFAERNLFGRFFKALNRTTQKFTPSYIRNMRSLGKELGEQVRRAANVQGFAGENFEEFLEQPLQYWLIAQTGREKELGKEKAWSDVYGEGFLVETLGTVALMQALFSLPSAAVGTRSVIDNHAMMRKHLSRLDEATVKKLRGVMALEDDNARAQGLAGLLRDAGTDQQRMDILGYAVSRAASNMGLSWQRAEAQGRETEAYRQTLMAASSDGTTVTTARDKEGNTFAVRSVEGDSYALAYPVEDNGDGTVSLGAPVQRSLSDFDRGSMAVVPLETYLQGLSARQRAQGQSEDAAARQQDMAASLPPIRADRPMQAVRPVTYFTTDMKKEKAAVEGSRIEAVADVPEGTAADAPVRVVVTAPNGKAEPGVMTYGQLQGMLADGTAMESEPVRRDPEHRVSVSGAAQGQQPLQTPQWPQGAGESVAQAGTGTVSGQQPGEVNRPAQAQPAVQGQGGVAVEPSGTAAMPQGQAQPGGVSQGVEAAVPAAQAVQATAQPSENRGGLIGRSLTEAEAEALISSMEANAETAPEVELNAESWSNSFDENNSIETPVGRVKMGDNQITKFFSKGREKEFGMVAPTLANPDVILEKEAPSQNAERGTKYLFIKTFIKPDGSRFVHFESVTVKKDGMEISISSHEADGKVIKKEMQNGVILHLNGKLSPDSERYLTGTPVKEGSDLVPTSDISETKGSADSGEKQSLGGKIAAAEEETNANPTEGQKQAGNYKKGHVRIGQFDISIENPKGSVRRGVDTNGKAWEHTMQNSYGYIRGTEGVDGDHIDVFLSDKIDGWNGSRAFVIDQYNEDGTFDEHKVMLGFNEQEDAWNAYLVNYEDGWADGRRLVITPVNIEDFENWIASSHRKTKPFAEYKGVNKEQIPLDEAGEPAYEQAPVQATWDDLMAQNGNDEKEALVTVQAMIENREAELESAQKEIGKKPKGKTVAEIQRSKAERKRKAEEASAKLDYWRKVAAWPEEKRKAEEHARKMNERNKRSLAAQKSQGMPFSKRHAEWGDAVSFREDFLRRLATGGVQISEETVRSMGMTKQDLAGFNRQYPPLVPKEGGKSIEQLADDLWSDIEGDSDKAATYWDARSREDVESVIRDVFGSVSSKKGAMEEAERLHGETLEEQQRKELEAAGIDPDAVPEAGTDESLEGQADTPEARKARLEERHRQRQEADAETRAWMEEMGLLNGEEPPFHRSGERGAEAPTEAEAELRDAIVGRLRESGIEVVEDSEAGQRVLDEVNERRENRKRKSANDTGLPERDALSKAAVISFADSAKIRNNLEKIAETYQDSDRIHMNTVLSELGRAIGAEQKGSNSQYVTIEAKNGNEVTIRLSDHNASVERMDNAGKDNAISIVISRKGNKGIQGTGEARIVEYYYSDKKLRQAGGKAVAAIARSLQQTLYSGEFKDTTGLADVDVKNAERIREQRVYHGSGADFDAFDHSHMGEGEGAQAYGWGSYVTEVEGIGRTYAEASTKDKRENKTVYKRAQIRENETSISVIKNMIAEFPEMQRKRERTLSEREAEYAELRFRKEKLLESQGEGSVEYRNFLFNNEDYISELERRIADSKRSIAMESEYNEQRKRQISEIEEENKRLQSEIEAIEAQHPRHLYTLEIPDNNGGNYLHWEKPVTEAQIKKIQAYLDKNYRRNKLDDFNASIAPVKASNADEVNAWSRRGENIYKTLSYLLGGDKAASEALSEMGFTGISYPAQYRSGGRSDGARNFVIFKESDMKITGKVKFFRTPQGEAYGFTVGGKIYLDPRIAKADTPIHEYAHLWASALREGNPEEWANVVGLMKDTPVWEEVKKLYPELETDEEVADEVLAIYSGRRGAERLREAMREAGKEDGLGGRLAAMEAVGRVREALQRFWHAVADFLHIRYTTTEEVADRVLSDLLEGVNPGAFSAMNNDIRFRRQGGHGDATDMESKRAAVEALGRKLNVEVVFEDEASLRKQPRQYRTASGWFDRAQWRKDGRRVIHVNLSNTGDAHEAEMTVLHEAVGHMGLRELLGAENYDPFLDMVHGIIPEAQSGRLRALVFKGHPDLARRVGEGNADAKDREAAEAELRRVMADEWLAELAEVGGEPGVWEQIVESFRMLLRRLGFELSLSEADIRALLFESRRNLESSRLPGEAERIREQQRDFREAARLDRIMEADMADMEADAGSEAPSFRQWYGGNSGYVGYSMSRRAAEAREEGRFPKTDFKKEYHVSEHALKALVRTGFIDGSEWHHTSKYGNRTPFYGWTDEASAQTYLDNKKEVDALSKEYDGLGMASPDNNADLFLEERLSAMRKERGYGMDFLTDGEKAERSRRMDEIGIADFGMDEAERARINAASEAVIDEYRELSGRRIREMEAEIQGMDEYKNRVEEEGRKEARRKEIEGRLEEIFGQQETGPEGVLFRQGGGASARPTRSQRRQAERMFRDDKIISAGKEREWTSRQRFRHGMANLQEFFNDSVRLRYLGNHIRRMGGRVSSATDLYELATTVPAKEQYRSERFELSCGRPLVSCVREILQKTGKKVRDLELYMIAKHGPERNRWMYNRKKLGELADDMAYEVRNESGITRPLGEAAKNRIIASIMKEYGGTDSYMDAAVARKMAADIYEALSKSHAASMTQEAMKAQGKGLSLPKDNARILTQEDLDGIAEKTQSSLLERAEKDTDTDKDFSGLSDFAKTTGTNPENYVARFEEEVEAAVPGGIDSFWEHLNAVTDFTLQTRLECGLMSKEAYQAIKDMGWSHYVPLRSWEEREEESLAYLDMEYPEMMDSEKTRKLYPKKAKGRHSLSAGPMGYIFQAAETAMKEGEKNLYLQAVGRLARENSGFTHLWTVSNAESAEAQRAEAMTLEEIHKTETGREAESHRVLYRVNGEYRYVDFVNPRMAAAVRGDRAMKWDRIWAGKLLKPLRNMTRLMSMLNTSLSSAFAIRNAIRDLQFAINSRIIEDGKRPVASGFIFIWNWMMSLPAAFRSTNDEWVMTSGSKQAGLVRLWKENGGETGWHTLKPLNELKRKIVRDMERGELAQRAKDKIEALPRMLQYTAEVLENSVRLAAFKDAMQRGKDAQEAAFYSKEVTTNFNRRSRMANVGGPVYMFLNASIQGLVRYAELFRKAPKAFLGFNAFMFLLGDMVSAMAAAGDDDDGEREYLKMSRYLRYTNWVVGHWTIPLAHGFKLPYGLGAAWREFQLGNMNEGELAVEVMHLFGNELLPGPLNLTTAINYDPSRMEMNLKEGGDYFIDLAPSPLVWYAEVQTNRDFMGNPIKRELYTKDQRDDVAEVARYMPNTNPMLLHFDEKIAGIGGYVPELDQKFTINKRLNGQLSWWLDWNPNSQEHMISSLFGSAGRGFMDITRLAGKIYNGEAITERDIPVLNKLYRSTDPEKSILMEYYRLHDYCEFYLKATSKSSKDVALPLISDESRNVALKRMEGLLSDEQYAVVLTFDEYRKKVDELLAMETQLRGYKQDSGALKEVRLEVQALANKLKLDLFKARDPERYQRMIDYNSIRDNDLRGFAAYMEMLKQQRKRRKAKVED